MSHRRLAPSRLLVLAAALALAACSDDDAPADTPCAAGGAPTTVRLHTRAQSQLLDVAPADATWVAYQDGACAWQRAQRAALGEYELPVTDARYGVAVVCADPARPDLVETTMHFGTLAEGTELTVTCATRVPENTPASALGMALDGTWPREVHMHFLANATSDVVVGDGILQALAYQVRAGVYDLALVASATDSQTMERVRVLRDLDAASGDHIEAVSDAAIEAWSMFGAPVTLVASAATDGGAWHLAVDYLTNRGTWIDLAAGFSDTGEALALDVPTMPAGERAAGDAYVLTLQRVDEDHTEVAQIMAAEPELGALPLPPPLGATLVGRGADLVLTVEPPAGTIDLTLTHEDFGDPRRIERWRFSPGWLAAAPPGELVLPLPSGAPGFDPTWRPDRAGSWKLVARGNDAGAAGESALQAIGKEPGAPAALIGTRVWLSQQLFNP